MEGKDGKSHIMKEVKSHITDVKWKPEFSGPWQSRVIVGSMTLTDVGGKWGNEEKNEKMSKKDEENDFLEIILSNERMQQPIG